MPQFRIRTVLALLVPVGVTCLLMRDSAPINIILIAVVWVIGLALIFMPSAFIPRRTAGYWLSALVLTAGICSFGGSVLFAIAHMMDPIGPDAEWWPLAFFGGLVAMAAGLLLLLGQRR